MDFKYQPPDLPLEIIYKDSSVIVLNKPSGLLTVPGRLQKHKDCLLSRAKRAFFGTLLVHRLDMDTSGVIIFARTSSAQKELNKQFEKREAKKIYFAELVGHIKDSAGTINLPIAPDWQNRPLQKICTTTGKHSLTKWKLIERTKENTSLVELIPVTGRSHQLRIHMKSIGYPIIGDSFYGSRNAEKSVDRLHLHASSLQIQHPKTGQTKKFQAECSFFKYF